MAALPHRPPCFARFGLGAEDAAVPPDGLGQQSALVLLQTEGKLVVHGDALSMSKGARRVPLTPRARAGDHVATAATWGPPACSRHKFGRPWERLLMLRREAFAAPMLSTMRKRRSNPLTEWQKKLRCRKKGPSGEPRLRTGFGDENEARRGSFRRPTCVPRPAPGTPRPVGPGARSRPL